MDGKKNSGYDGSEDEVFLVSTEASPVTSTPNTGPAKRKREDTSVTRNTRRRSSRLRAMSDSKSKNGSSEMDEAEFSDGVTPSLTTKIKQMSIDIAKLTKNVSGIQESIINTVAMSVAPLSVKIDETAKRMDDLEAKQTAEFAALRDTVGDQIKLAVNKKVKEIERKLGDGEEEKNKIESYARKAAASPSHKKKKETDNHDWYWKSMKCLRMYPIPGKTEKEIMT